MLPLKISRFGLGVMSGFLLSSLAKCYKGKKGERGRKDENSPPNSAGKTLLLTNSIAKREAGCPKKNPYLDMVGVKFPSLKLVVVFHSVVLRVCNRKKYVIKVV